MTHDGHWTHFYVYETKNASLLAQQSTFKTYQIQVIKTTNISLLSSKLYSNNLSSEFWVNLATTEALFTYVRLKIERITVVIHFLKVFSVSKSHLPYFS